MTDDESRLIEYALGSLDEKSRQDLERAFRERHSLRTQLKEVSSLLDKIADANAPVQPGPQVRERLLRSVQAETRFEGYVARLSVLFDLGVERVREILEVADRDPKVWRDAGIPGVALMHFDGGPRVATADCGLVRLEPGAEFPHHRHIGDELALVLQGQARDDAGCVFRPGDFVHMTDGSSHGFCASDSDTLLLAVVLNGGIEPA